MSFNQIQIPLRQASNHLEQASTSQLTHHKLVHKSSMSEHDMAEEEFKSTPAFLTIQRSTSTDQGAMRSNTASNLFASLSNNRKVTNKADADSTTQPTNDSLFDR